MDLPTDCTRCNYRFHNDAIDMGNGKVWCPKCYILYRYMELEQKGIVLSDYELRSALDGRLHIDDLVRSKTFEPRNKVQS